MNAIAKKSLKPEPSPCFVEAVEDLSGVSIPKGGSDAVYEDVIGLRRAVRSQLAQARRDNPMLEAGLNWVRMAIVLLGCDFTKTDMAANNYKVARRLFYERAVTRSQAAVNCNYITNKTAEVLVAARPRRRQFWGWHLNLIA